MTAGDLISGIIYSQIQNIKTTYYYQTKLRILILYEKREDLGWSFLVGGVSKWRRSKIKLVVIKFCNFIFDRRNLWTPPTRRFHPRSSLFSYTTRILSLFLIIISGFYVLDLGINDFTYQITSWHATPYGYRLCLIGGFKRFIY